MAHCQIGKDVTLGKINVGVEVGQGGWLDWAAYVDEAFLNGIGKLGVQHIPHKIWGWTVDDQAEGPLGGVAADEDDGPMEKRSGKPSPIQKEVPLQRFFAPRHVNGTMADTCRDDNPD